MTSRILCYDGFSMLPLPNRRVFFFSLK